MLLPVFVLFPPSFVSPKAGLHLKEFINVLDILRQLQFVCKIGKFHFVVQHFLFFLVLRDILEVIILSSSACNSSGNEILST